VWDDKERYVYVTTRNTNQNSSKSIIITGVIKTYRFFVVNEAICEWKRRN